LAVTVVLVFLLLFLERLPLMVVAGVAILILGYILLALAEQAVWVAAEMPLLLAEAQEMLGLPILEAVEEQGHLGQAVTAEQAAKVLSLSDTPVKLSSLVAAMFQQVTGM